MSELRPLNAVLDKEVHVPELKIALTREKLYVKLWRAPMQKLAAEFGFSDRTASTFLTYLHCLNGLSNYQKPHLLIRRAKKQPLECSTDGPVSICLS